MQVTHPSILATIVMALIYMGLARLWYSKQLFGAIYMDCSTKKESDSSCCGMSPAKQIIAFIQSFVMAFILGYVVNAFQPASAAEGMKIGAVAWLGFIAANELSAVIWSGKTIKTYLIDIGFMLVVFAIWGTVYAVWK